MICSKLPNQEAHAKRNIIFREDRKLVLFITVEHLLEMIAYREVDEDCGSACKKDPVSGVIGVEQGPLILVV